MASPFQYFIFIFFKLKRVFELRKVAKTGQLDSTLSGLTVKSGAHGPMAQSKTLQGLKLEGRQSLHYRKLW